MISRTQAKTRSAVIRDETGAEQNTHTRVGGLFYDLSDSVVFIGDVVVPPLSETVYVDPAVSISPSLRDGSIGRPYATIQAAIDAHPGKDFLRIIAVPGTYIENLAMDRFLGAHLVIASATPLPSQQFEAASGVLIQGDVSLTGAEGASVLTLQDTRIQQNTLADELVTTFLSLIRAQVSGPSISASAISYYDTDSSVDTLAGATQGIVRDITSNLAFTDSDVVTDRNPFLANLIFSGGHVLSGYLRVGTVADTGTLDLTVNWSDDGGAKSLKVIDALDVTVAGPGYATFTLPLALTVSPVTYTVVLNGFTGSLTYGIRVGLHSMG